MGLDPAGNEMPIFAVPLAKFAVSFAPQKGDFIGRKPLEQQFAAFKRIMNRDFSDLSVLPHRIPAPSRCSTAASCARVCPSTVVRSRSAG